MTRRILLLICIGCAACTAFVLWRLMEHDLAHHPQADFTVETASGTIAGTLW